MANSLHLERYKLLRQYIDNHLKESIDIQIVEEITHYSYRNMNRIFLALHQETIGKYIKRIRLEKAAEYLKYSNESVGDIAFEIGFNDIAAFSKAFKKKFQCSPSAFREKGQITATPLSNQKPLDFRIPYHIEYLPDFEVLYLEHRGAYDNFVAIEKTWNQLENYGVEQHLIHEHTTFLAEILDDETINTSIHCRYNAAMVLDRPFPNPTGLFDRKTIPAQKYIKALHKGSYTTTSQSYQKLYLTLLEDGFQLADQSMLEFFLNDPSTTPAEELLTEIYIPIL